MVTVWPDLLALHWRQGHQHLAFDLLLVVHIPIGCIPGTVTTLQIPCIITEHTCLRSPIDPFKLLEVCCLVSWHRPMVAQGRPLVRPARTSRSRSNLPPSLFKASSRRSGAIKSIQELPGLKLAGERKPTSKWNCVVVKVGSAEGKTYEALLTSDCSVLASCVLPCLDP